MATLHFSTNDCSNVCTDENSKSGVIISFDVV